MKKEENIRSLRGIVLAAAVIIIYFLASFINFKIRQGSLPNHWAASWLHSS